MLSRRSLFLAVSSCFTALSQIAAIASRDVDLMELAREFETLASTIDLAVDNRAELTEPMLHRLDALANSIDHAPATTLDGLRVKARVAAWALLGDLDAQQDSGLAQQMSRSIVRDLIRTFDRDRERPGSVARLIPTD